MKREDVIDWLEYLSDDARVKADSIVPTNIEIACKIAIEALKAQEPVKLVFERRFMTSIEIYDCGKCGTSLGAKGIAKYCMDCGQAVKWE